MDGNKYWELFASRRSSESKVYRRKKHVKSCQSVRGNAESYAIDIGGRAKTRRKDLRLDPTWIMPSNGNKARSFMVKFKQLVEIF
jgi:hypothetical protein